MTKLINVPVTVVKGERSGGGAALPPNVGGASEALSRGMETVFQAEKKRREKEDINVTIKCFEDGCDEDVVVIERYHADGKHNTARWELKDGEWHHNGVGRFDQGTHHHVFCAAYDAEAHYWATVCGCGDVCRNDCKGECEDACVCECVCDFSDREAAPGHEYKRWGRYLPVELARVVYPGNFSKEGIRRREEAIRRKEKEAERTRAWHLGQAAKEHSLTMREVPDSEGYYDLVDKLGNMVCGDTHGLGANADLFEIEEYLAGLRPTCDSHQGKRVMTKEQAEKLAEDSQLHLGRLHGIDAYQCPEDSSHYHIGHTPKSVIDAAKAE